MSSVVEVLSSNPVRDMDNASHDGRNSPKQTKKRLGMSHFKIFKRKDTRNRLQNSLVKITLSIKGFELRSLEVEVCALSTIYPVPDANHGPPYTLTNQLLSYSFILFIFLPLPEVHSFCYSYFPPSKDVDSTIEYISFKVIL